MEIRDTTITCAKRKVRGKRDEKRVYLLLARFDQLQEQLRTNYDETIKYEMERVKSKLAKIVSINEKNS